MNGDSAVTVADIFYLINYLFVSGPALIGLADVNDDGQATVADIFHLINFLFAGGPAPIESTRVQIHPDRLRLRVLFQRVAALIVAEARFFESNTGSAHEGTTC